MLSEKKSYGTSFQLVFSLKELRIYSKILFEIESECAHSVRALHTNGFRDHIHWLIWLEPGSKHTFRKLQLLMPKAFIQKVNKTYFASSAEVNCNQGYQRVYDYILRDLEDYGIVLYKEKGSLQKALSYEYMSELNKEVLKQEKEASKHKERTSTSPEVMSYYRDLYDQTYGEPF